MKEKQTKMLYVSPEEEVVEVKACDMLCDSTKINFGIKDDEGYIENNW